MRFIWVIIALTFSAAVGLPPASNAQENLKIAAVVNEDAVSVLDLVTRLRLAFVSGKLEDTPENRRRLAPQILRSLIDEKLKLQAATANQIRVSDAEIQKRLEDIAKRANANSLQEFEAFLQQNGVLLETMASQLRADIAWARVVQRRFRSQVNVTDSDIEAEIGRLQESGDATEYRLSQIFLSVNNAGDEANVRDAANRLMEQIQQGGDFATLATQFSQDQGALKGGDFGWVRLDQLEPDIAQVVQSLPEGQISQPIRGSNGYYLLMVRRTRSAELDTGPGTVALRQIFWSLPSNAAESEVSRAVSQARTLIPNIRSCDDIANIANQAAPGVYRDLGNVLVSELEPEVQNIVLNLEQGQPSDPVRSSKGVGLYVVCDRGSGEQGQLSKVQVANRLTEQRLETLARGYLSDLRRSAYIDIRL